MAGCSLGNQSEPLQEIEERALNEVMSLGSPSGSVLIESSRQISTGTQENCYSAYAEALYGSSKSRVDTLEYYYRRIGQSGWKVGELSKYKLSAASPDERFFLGVGVFTPRVASNRLYPYVRAILPETIDAALAQHTTAFAVYVSYIEPWMQTGCP
jgi:hypothetical protein